MFGAVGTLRYALPVYALSSVVVTGTALGAQDAEEVDESSDRAKALRLDYLEAYLEFEGQFDYTKVESSQRRGLGRDRRQRNRDWQLEERIGLRLGGAALDPGFITFGGEVSFAFTQARFDEHTDRFNLTDEDRGHLFQYDLRMNFLPGRQLSGSVYARRQDDRINRRFQPTLDQRRTGFGTSWYYAHDTFPMTLSYDYLETDRTGNADRQDNEHFTESTLRYGVDWLASERHRVNFSYEHANTKQEYQGLREAFETTRDLFIIDQELHFGDQGRHVYRTRVHWQEESGDFARDLFEIGPQLSLRHGDNLQTLYKYQFNRERYEGLDVETHRVDWQLVHQMYTNLTTTVDVFGLFEDVENDINTTQYGASVDWQYNRRNRFGRLFANLALAYDTEEVDGDDGRRIILDEAHAFHDPIAITLRHRDVVETSVLVTDSTNRRIYQRGIDYHLVPQGNATRISRIRSGRIADGDTVLIDYQIRTPQHGQLDTVRIDFSLEQRFTNGLTPYYRLSYRNQEDDISTGFARRADRTDHHRVGCNYERKRYTLGAEIEVFDDTIDPYDAFHLSGLLHVLQGMDHSLDASTRFSRLSFDGGPDDRDVSMLDLGLDHRWRLAEAWSTVERIAYRLEADSRDGDTHAWDVIAGLQYARGDLSGELTFEYDRLDLPGSQEDNLSVYLRIRRELPNVLAR